jgi:hypothetical protein
MQAERSLALLALLMSVGVWGGRMAPQSACDLTPIIIPLHPLPGGPYPDGHQGEQIHLTSPESGVVFDLTETCPAAQVAWIADEQSGFLAIDRDGDGRITGGHELFGNHTLPGDNGWAAIADLLMPGHQSGVFSSADHNFDKLLIWVDRNHNGHSEPGELVAANTVITSITTGAMDSGQRDRYGNVFVSMGKVTYVGAPPDDWRPVYGVRLRTIMN